MSYELKNKKITVMGIGLHGGAVDLILWLLKQGARVTATDIKSGEDLAPSLEKLMGQKNLRLVLGQHHMDDFINADLVIKNPGISWDNKYIQTALKNNISVEMDAGLFFHFCPSKKIIGITGTKGKTTTATIIYSILKLAGKKPVAVGIGQGNLMSKLENVGGKTPIVFELSSWRLSALRRKKISPFLAVITNIYPDHLNYYSSMEDYVKDKEAIFQNQKKDNILVVNYDQQEGQDFAKKALGQVVFFSQKKLVEEDEENIVFLKNKDIYYRSKQGEELIMNTDEIRMRGAHNLSNVLAAIAATLNFGIEAKLIKKAIKEFRGIQHRLEFVRKIDKVSFYNDTAATTPESAIAAFNSFQRPIYLIAGGSSKNLQLDELAKEIVSQKIIKKVFLLEGTATSELKKLIKEYGGESKLTAIFTSLGAATQEAYEAAKRGEELEKGVDISSRVVLLSPGCASFGMFENEFDRGDKFKKVVRLFQFVD